MGMNYATSYVHDYSKHTEMHAKRPAAGSPSRAQTPPVTGLPRCSQALPSPSERDNGLIIHPKCIGRDTQGQGGCAEPPAPTGRHGLDGLDSSPADGVEAAFATGTVGWRSRSSRLPAGKQEVVSQASLFASPRSA